MKRETSTSRNLAGGGRLLDEIHHQREEVDPRARIRVRGRNEYDRLSVRDQGRAVGLFGQSAGLYGHLAAADFEGNRLGIEPI